MSYGYPAQPVYGHQMPPQAYNNTQQPHYHQPSPQEKMSISSNVDHLNATHKARNGSGEREFSTGLCGAMCSETGSCLASGLLCCCPCVYGNAKKRFSSLNSTGTPSSENGYCASGTWIYGLLTCFGVGCILDCALRGDIRQRYKIKGNGCFDCMASCCCLPCNQAQMRYEIRQEEVSRQGQVLYGAPQVAHHYV